VTTERRKSFRIESRRFTPCCRIIGAVSALAAMILLGSTLDSCQGNSFQAKL
jgi:hypothetical protein